MASVDEPETIAHVQLSREHAERRTFWLDVLAAIARARPELSGLAVPRRGSRSLAAIRAALGDLPEPLRLVLDDLHLVGASEALADLEWLIEHVPNGLRLIVATRSDPPIRLQRLRLAGQLKEVRADELAFTPSEAAEFFAPLSLPPDDIERLWKRAEGWAAALRLAELSLQDHPNPREFIAGFAGDDRAVSDYLMSEVVSSYEEDTLLFLLRTSILDRLNGELAAEIPAAVVDADAELALAMAGLLLEAGEIEAADGLLVRAYELAEELPAERRRRFTVTSAATALYRARLKGDVAEAVSAARLALQGQWDRSVAVEVRALTLANLGIAEFWADSVEDALEHLQAAAGLALEFGNDFVLFLAESYLAAVDARQGRLGDARSRAHTAIQLAERRGWAELPDTAIAYAALATVHLWWNELDEAERAGELAREALGRSPEPLLPPVVAQIRARILALRGDAVTALELLRGGDPDRQLPPWLHVTASLLEADLWLALGEPGRARTSLEAISSAPVPDAAVGLARLELALGEPVAALRAIAGFMADEREPLMPVSRTETWAIAAIARDAIHDEPGALLAIERALDLAEPRGYSYPIIRHGAPIRSLLRRRIASGTAHRAFAGELLSSLEQERSPRRPNGDPLLEPLSDRELTVLRFLPTMMSNAEIASEMFVSVNTVKTHLKHIYRKLDVSERRDAVRRGRELHLLSPGITQQ